MATEVQKVVDKWGEKIVNNIKKKLLTGDKYATGQLVNSINYKAQLVSGLYVMQISGAPQLLHVDRGRRPGKYVPIKPLINWIKVKHINVGGRKPMVSGKKVPNEQLNKRMAYAISATIKKRGIKPFPILNLATIIKSSSFRLELAKAAASDFKKQFKGL